MNSESSGASPTSHRPADAGAPARGAPAADTDVAGAADAAAFPDAPPACAQPLPGPRTRAWARRLAEVECPDTTYLGDDFPVFWERARGANVWDADGNRYVDLTGAFGVALFGHGHPRLLRALHAQAADLVHGMGDVHPSAAKVLLAERLRALAPGDLDVVQFGVTGSDAVECALKTAAVATGRPGVVAFEGAYHGLGYGALAVTARADFRRGFEAQLNPHVVHVPFPDDPATLPPAAAARATPVDQVLDTVDRLLAGRDDLGAVIVEPIQGRAGVRVPDPALLPGLREICTRRGVVWIADEIFTGLGRTGYDTACAAAAVVPDILAVGKGLGGGLPISAAIGRREILDAWGRSRGEARHTSTFLGHPLACRVAIEVLDMLRQQAWSRRVRERGALLGEALGELAAIDGVGAVRGRGFFWGLELVDARGAPDATRCGRVVRALLQHGVLMLGGGHHHNVLQCTPPYVLGEVQQRAALAALHDVLTACPPTPTSPARPSTTPASPPS